MDTQVCRVVQDDMRGAAAGVTADPRLDGVSSCIAPSPVQDGARARSLHGHQSPPRDDCHRQGILQPNWLEESLDLVCVDLYSILA